MDLQKLEKLIELVRKHGIHELTVEDKDTKISVTASAPSGVQGYMPAAPPPYYGNPMAGMSQASFAPPPQPPSGAEAGAIAAQAAQPLPPGKLIKSPFVGTFYRSASPGSDPFVSIGQRVKKGDPLCIVEAMKLMNEIEAEQNGVIKEILVDNEQPVEFDQPLFIME